MQFFALNGFPCPTLQNPSDHFVKTINKDFEQVNTYFSSCETNFSKAVVDGNLSDLLYIPRRTLSKH